MKARKIGIALGLVFAMVLALSQVATAAPAATYDISFDGYCDGMQLNIPSQGLGSPDTVDGMHTGCVTGGLIGTKSSAPNAAHLTSFGDFQGFPLHTQVNANHTWVHYGIAGNLITFINSGTWSFGPPRGSGSPSSVSGGTALTGTPDATFNIVFDGYCDGMSINIPSQGLGSPDTVDGSHTGCISGGFMGTRSSSPNAASITTTYGGAFPLGIQFLVNANHTWTIYGRNGNLIYFINSGTWSFGIAQGSGGPAALG